MSKELDRSDFPVRKTQEFTFEQLKAIEYLALPKRGGKMLKEIAEEIGISERQLRRWRRDERFLAEVRRRSMQLMSESLPDVNQILMEQIMKTGSAKHLELFYRTQGLLKDTQHLEVSQVVDRRSNEAIQEEIEELRRMLNEDDNVIEADYEIIDGEDDDNE
jgi:transposase-like protein